MSINNLPLLSVIIPYYNHNQYIRKTLDSIISDTYPNKEIIIINDGSTEVDDSNIRDWILEYKESLSILYIKRENCGVSKTMNELIRLAKGDYILPCSSDDFFINNTIYERIELLKKHSDKSILISDNIVIDENDALLFNSNLFEMRQGIKTNYYSNAGLKIELIKRWGLAGPSWLAKKELFEVIGLYDESLIVEDWDFILRALSKNLILFYDQPVSAYRIHKNNTAYNLHKKKRISQDLAKTAYQNIKHFDSLNIKILLYKQYLYICLALYRMDIDNACFHSSIKQDYKTGKISWFEYLLFETMILKDLIYKKFKYTR